MSKIQFDWAKPGQSSVFLGITGATGSGKTKSALRIAEGLKGSGGTIYMIDTEGGRGLHYATEHQYKYGQLTQPFTYARYLEAIRASGATQDDVVIVDSASHAHEGPGGLLEQHEAELDRMAGNDYKRREAVKFAAWIKPKAEYTRFVNSLQQLNRNVIMCFRAKEKMAMVQGKKGMEPVSTGWQPICTEGLAYEMTAMLVLPPGSEGVPDLGAEARKMPSYIRNLFDNRQLSEDMGRALRRWADGGEIKRPPERKPEPPRAQPEGDPRDSADTGAFIEEGPQDGRPALSNDIDPKIAYANEAVALIHSKVGDFLHWWNGLSQDDKYDNLTPASFQRFAVELAKYSDSATINAWVATLTPEEKGVLAPVRETVRSYLQKGRQ